MLETFLLILITPDGPQVMAAVSSQETCRLLGTLVSAALRLPVACIEVGEAI